MADALDSNKSPLEHLETQAQLRFIKEVFDAKLPVRLWGGCADDALLSGRILRRHHDVDLAAMRSDMDSIKLAFERLGYVVTEELFGKNDKPYKLLVRGKNALADVALFDHDEDDHPIIDIPYSKTGKRYQISFDDEMFHPVNSSIEGIPVITVSPLALIRSKDAYFQAGVARSRLKDVTGKTALVTKFFPTENPDSEHFKLHIRKEKI